MGEWYKSKENYFPPEFTKTTLIEMVEREKDGKYYWNGVTYNEKDWKEKVKQWEKDYPNIKNSDGSTFHESVSVRTKATNDVKNIDFCWDNLKRIKAPATLSSKSFIEKYRVDMYGNVVSKDATNDSLTKFDVDHLFPWSRGGRSVQSNFAGVYHTANRGRKNDKLIQFLSKSEMLCGISEEQFVNIIIFLESKGDSRKTLSSNLDIFKGYLLNGPKNGDNIKDFQVSSKGSSDGAYLWKWFAERDLSLLGDRLKSDSTIKPKITLIISPTTVELHLQMIIYSIFKKGYLESEFGLNYDEKDNCWFMKYSDKEEGDRLVAKIKDSIKMLDVDLEITINASDEKKIKRKKKDEDDDGGKKDYKRKDEDETKKAIKKNEPESKKMDDDTSSAVKIFGKTTTGENCKNCMKNETGFCKKHLDQKK